MVFAPNARRVSVVGDFNFWDGRRHAMRVRGNGYWEIFVPGARAGDKYKYEIVGPRRRSCCRSRPIRSAFAAEQRPSTASIVVDAAQLPRPVPLEHDANALDAPISIYEVHLGSWRRKPEEGDRWLTYRELAEQLPAYAADMGFTHIELLPVIGASVRRLVGLSADRPVRADQPLRHAGGFRRADRRLPPRGPRRAARLGAGAFPRRSARARPFRRHRALRARQPDAGPPSRLGHADLQLRPRRGGELPASPTRCSGSSATASTGCASMRSPRCSISTTAGRQAAGFRTATAGARTSTPSSSCAASTPRCSRAIRKATTIAEESTAWPMVSRPVDWGGLGFGYKWNMGWMHDTLDYISKEPIHRRHHHGNILFGLHYAFSENFILPLSHDEVVHGKRSILGRMPGDEWQRFANLRAYYGFMFGHPGKKLMFMGCEFGQDSEWNHDHSLPTGICSSSRRTSACSALVRDLNTLYRDDAGAAPARLRRRRASNGWSPTTPTSSVFAWLRKGSDPKARCVVVVNFTPEVRRDYRVRVPFAGRWREVLNTDAAHYGGSNVGNAGACVRCCDTRKPGAAPCPSAACCHLSRS